MYAMSALDSGLVCRRLSHSQAGPTTAAIHGSRGRQILHTKLPQSQKRESNVVSAAERLATTEEDKAVANRTVLDKFWRERGVHDEAQRECLIQMAGKSEEVLAPSIHSTWTSGRSSKTFAPYLVTPHLILKLGESLMYL